MSSDSGYAIPIRRLRKGGDEALNALREARLLSADGPRRLELLLISDLLRKNRRIAATVCFTGSNRHPNSPPITHNVCCMKLMARDLIFSRQVSKDVEGSASEVMSVIDAARRGKLGVEEWEARVTAMMVGGETRRAHFKSLIAASVLRDVGFSAASLLAIDYTARELRDGGYPAKDLRKLRYSPSELSELGYSAASMKEAGLSASELQGVGCSAADLREASFTAAELRGARYSLSDLKAAGYGAADLKEAEYTCSELRGVGFSVADMRVETTKVESRVQSRVESKESKLQLVFPATSLREAGYSAV